MQNPNNQTIKDTYWNARGVFRAMRDRLEHSVAAAVIAPVPSTVQSLPQSLVREWMLRRLSAASKAHQRRRVDASLRNAGSVGLALPRSHDTPLTIRAQLQRIGLWHSFRAQTHAICSVIEFWMMSGVLGRSRRWRLPESVALYAFGFLSTADSFTGLACASRAYLDIVLCHAPRWLRKITYNGRYAAQRLFESWKYVSTTQSAVLLPLQTVCIKRTDVWHALGFIRGATSPL